MLAQAARTTSPWWGVPVVAGFFAIFGVVVSQLVTYFNERRKERRRLEADVRAACSKFLSLGRQTTSYGREPAEGFIAELIESYYEIRFVAPVSVIRPAADILDVLIEYERLRLDELDKQHELMRRISELRYSMIEELRKWLGLDRYE